MDTLQRRGTIPSDHLEPLLRLVPRTIRFWRTGLVVGLSVAIVATAVSFLLPKKFRSEAVLLYREGLQWRADEAANPRRVGQRLRDVLLARAQLSKVIEELELFPRLVADDRMAEAVEEMRNRTDFRFDRGDVFVLSYTGETPVEARRVTAKLTDVLALENARLRTQQAELARKFLELEKKRKEEELAEKEAEQLRFLARHPEFAQEQLGPPGQVGVTLRSRTRGGTTAVLPQTRDTTALGALRREEQRLRRQLASPGDIPPAPVDPALLAAKTDAETKVRDSRRELTDRRARFTEQHPDVRSAAARLADAEAGLRRATEAIAAAERESVISPGALKDRLSRVEQDIANYQREHPQARDASPDRNDAAKRIVALETEWTRLNREVTEAHDRLQALENQQFTASMTASMVTSGQTAQLITIDPANLPAAPMGMGKSKRLGVSAALALVIGLLTMIGRAVFDDLVYDRRDVERLEFTEVLAEVPGPALAAVEGTPEDRAVRALRLGPAPVAPAPPAAERPPVLIEGSSAPSPATPPETSGAIVRGAGTAVAARGLSDAVCVHRLAGNGATDPRVFMMTAPQGPAAAAFRILRHRLRPQAAQTILVTSPRPGEGKTLTAVNLAFALSEGGRERVLLVEVNGRSPAVASWLGFQPPVCFAEQLQQHGARPGEPWAVVETATHWLHVAALAPSRSDRTISGRALGACLGQLREAGYSHIVLDGPAILEGAEANAVEEAVDGVLLTLRARTSRALELRRAAEQIGYGKLLGVVLLGT